MDTAELLMNALKLCGHKCIPPSAPSKPELIKMIKEVSVSVRVWFLGNPAIHSSHGDIKIFFTVGNIDDELAIILSFLPQEFLIRKLKNRLILRNFLFFGSRHPLSIAFNERQIFFKIYLFYVSEFLPACESVYHICAVTLEIWRGIRVTGGCESLCWHWEMNPSPWLEQQVLLTTEPFLYPDEAQIL